MSISSVRTSGRGCPGRKQLSGLFSKKYSTLCLPSSCGMLVYNEDTSIDASMHFGGTFVVSISFRNSVVSFRYAAGALLAVNK